MMTCNLLDTNLEELINTIREANVDEVFLYDYANVADRHRRIEFLNDELDYWREGFGDEINDKLFIFILNNDCALYMDLPTTDSYNIIYGTSNVVDNILSRANSLLKDKICFVITPSGQECDDKTLISIAYRINSTKRVNIFTKDDYTRPQHGTDAVDIVTYRELGYLPTYTNAELERINHYSYIYTRREDYPDNSRTRFNYTDSDMNLEESRTNIDDVRRNPLFRIRNPSTSDVYYKKYLKYKQKYLKLKNSVKK